jgi:hypothetical protein
MWDAAHLQQGMIRPRVYAVTHGTQQIRSPVDLRPLPWPALANILAVGLILGGKWGYGLYLDGHAEISLADDRALSRTYEIEPDPTQSLTLGTYRHRPFLRLTPNLHNPSPVGDCVAPATIEVVPVFDKVPQSTPVKLRSGGAAAIAVPKRATRLALQITLREPPLYARITKERSPLCPWFFAGGYLLTWTVPDNVYSCPTRTGVNRLRGFARGWLRPRRRRLQLADHLGMSLPTGLLGSN